MKVALTGGATGIGAAAAAQLKEAGHEVTAFDIHEPTKNVDKWIRTDLSDPVSIAAAVVRAEGPYDALLNNAGQGRGADEPLGLEAARLESVRNVSRS